VPVPRARKIFQTVGSKTGEIELDIDCSCEYAVGNTKYTLSSASNEVSIELDEESPVLDYSKVEFGTNKLVTINRDCIATTETRVFKKKIGVEIYKCSDQFCEECFVWNTNRYDCSKCPLGYALATDKSGCMKCGDKVVSGTEQCDDGNRDNFDGCTNSCMNNICGDGFKAKMEECDDGNLNNNDGCSSTCKIERCGDGVRQNQEECDDGNKIEDDLCDNNCNKCGNGRVDPHEECDDGNSVANDTCTNACKLNKVCGNGIRELDEKCDDGLKDKNGCN